MNGFDTSTRTDALGHFELTLPPQAAQPGQGLSGAFTIYYYVDNFRMGMTDALVDDGEFIFDTDEIGPDGSLRRPKELLQTFTVKTAMTPVSAETKPPDLLMNLGAGTRELGSDYLNLPIVREGGEFKFDPDSGN